MNEEYNQKLMELQCKAFNEVVSPGDPVLVIKDTMEIEEHKVSYPAQILSGHTAVVYLSGIGAYKLDRVFGPVVKVVEEEKSQ